jgi:tyrosinase
MWPWSREKHSYVPVSSEEVEAEATRSESATRGRTASKRRPVLVAIIGLLLILVALGFAIVYFILSGSPFENQDDVATSQGKTACPKRHGWRTLSGEDRQEYISAVLCLRSQPSVLAPSKQTLYDDFPWIHSRVGYFTHNSAPFLPWHRYFLHVYERTLREKCNYTGGLVYWDWTLDSEAIEDSPVFDPKTGFGGDGEVGGELTISNTGRCVVDGPFAGIEVPYYDVKYQPHCLSRGFRDLDGNLGHIDGSDITPESIEEVLGLEDYESFVTLMESRVHDAIPYGISGDFETFTAPYGESNFLVIKLRLTVVKTHYSSYTIRNWIGFGGCGSNASLRKECYPTEVTKNGILSRWLAWTIYSTIEGSLPILQSEKLWTRRVTYSATATRLLLPL